MGRTVANFYRELQAAGVALCVRPGGFHECGADRVSRVVYLGADATSDATEAAIVGLHELGHIATDSCSFFSSLLYGSELANYSNELAAWAWASDHIDAADRALFEEFRAWSLNSHRGNEIL